MKIAIALLLGFLIGAGCRWMDVPVPAPPKLLGALLIVSITLGFMAADWYLQQRSGGPKGPAEAVQRRP